MPKLSDEDLFELENFSLDEEIEISDTTASRTNSIDSLESL